MSPAPFRRVFCLVLDSLGVGAMPDAGQFGDEGAFTLGHIAEHVDGLSLPRLQAMGLGRIATVRGMAAPEEPEGAFGKLAERSPAKDTTTGHWEMMGCPLRDAFPVFLQGFPDDIITRFTEAISVSGVLCNEPASGTEVIERLGREHLETGKPIVYTSADSVFQIAAHEERIPIEQLYDWCEKARAILNPHQVARVIARPFIGEPGSFQRTYNRRDFSLEPPTDTVLDRLEQARVPVFGVGKIEDIFAGRGVTHSLHTEGNRDGMEAVCDLARKIDDGFVFCNLVDFDMLYGHRRDPGGYAKALIEFDDQLATLQQDLRDDDLLVLSADHGNDPVHSGTDHTREYVPFLLWNTARRVRGDVGTRETFADLGATVADAFSVPCDLPGTSVLPLVL